jgi:autotransporter passenger strand-loop-strand repeat protein
MTVNSGHQEVVAGGRAIFTTVCSGAGVVSSSGTASFTTVSSGGTEVVRSGSIANDTVMSFGGMIDVTYLPLITGGSTSMTSTGLLTVSVGGQSYTQQLAEGYAAEKFVLGLDIHGGTLVTAEAPCYRRGTHLLTCRGEIAVEGLRIGDLVQTVLGKAEMPIIWIGRREVGCVRHPKSRQVRPARIAAGAFDPGQPHRVLWLSPDHAIYVEGVLIPVCHLIYGNTIAQVPVDSVTYYHIELAAHDVLLAEGLSAEFPRFVGRVELCEPPRASVAVPGLSRPNVGGIRLRAADRYRAGAGSGACPGRKLRYDTSHRVIRLQIIPPFRASTALIIGATA